MRLIDADLFLENAKNELNCEGKCCECDYYNLCEIYKMVEKQPTAYDVDKVIQQLEKYIECDICSLRRDGCITPYCERCGAAGALEIVKSGGID